MALTYKILLSLHGGQASVVEKLSPEEIDLLWVESPVARFIREEASKEHPRHIFLSGSAGDGKTTLLKKCAADLREPTWHVEEDASDEDVPELERRLSGFLGQGRRLAVAINRGQLDRLSGRLQEHAPEGELSGIIKAVKEGLKLRATWTEEDLAPLEGVVSIDLSRQDNLSEGLVEAVLERALSASAPSGPTAKAAFEAAKAILNEEEARGRLLKLLRAVAVTGEHVTMRDLWAYVANLLTGGRPDDVDGGGEPVSLRDSVAVRMFEPSALMGTVTLANLVRTSADPAREPWPALNREFLLQGLQGSLGGLEGLAPLMREEGAPVDGAQAVRIAWLHGHEELRDWDPLADQNKLFKILVGHASAEEGWLNKVSLVKKLMADLVQVVGLRVVGNDFPAWRRLAYQVGHREEAPLVANSNLTIADLRLGLPRPNPDAREALEERYSIPYIWIAVAGDEYVRVGLTPRLAWAIDAQAQASVRRLPELEGVLGWLERLPTEETEEVRVRTSKISLTLARNLYERLELQQESVE